MTRQYPMDDELKRKVVLVSIYYKGNEPNVFNEKTGWSLEEKIYNKLKKKYPNVVDACLDECDSELFDMDNFLVARILFKLLRRG
mgnify:CR=1 FL=1